MNLPAPPRPRRAACLKRWALSVLCALCVAPTNAFQAAARFDVNIRLHPPLSASCGTGTNDNLAAVICDGGNYRFMAYLQRDQLQITGDSYAGTGISTAYRVVDLPDRQYIEMTVGW